MANALDLLLPFEWRGINFPTASFEVEVSQDHVEHKWPDRDGAHIEGVGRNPLVITARIPMRNGVSPGKQESFAKGALYPGVYLKFLAACADRSTGTLRHPELGRISVKCKSCKTHWDANRRDGVDIDVVWVETTDKSLDDIIDKDEASISGRTGAQEAKDLDDAIDSYRKRGPTPENPLGAPDAPFLRAHPPPGLPNMSFGQVMNNITGIFDTANLFTRSLSSRINEVAFRLDTLSAAVDRAKDPQTWPIRQSIERLRAALHRIQGGADKDQFVLTYIVPRETTLGAVSAYLGVSVNVIMEMNPDRFVGCVVLGGTVIRYPAVSRPQRR
jgi:hypothetical protein